MLYNDLVPQGELYLEHYGVRGMKWKNHVYVTDKYYGNPGSTGRGPSKPSSAAQTGRGPSKPISTAQTGRNPRKKLKDEYGYDRDSSSPRKPDSSSDSSVISRSPRKDRKAAGAKGNGKKAGGAKGNGTKAGGAKGYAHKGARVADKYRHTKISSTRVKR